MKQYYKIFIFFIAGLITAFTLILLFGCSQANTPMAKMPDNSLSAGGEVAILQSWQGDYPVDKLNQLPENQREHGIGYIDNAETFNQVWKAFKPGEDVPESYFRTNLVLFARNTQFYNLIRIGQVNVKNGVAEVLAMETMSAMPIEDRVAMSMVVVSRKGITGIQSGGEIIPISR